MIWECRLRNSLFLILLRVLGLAGEFWFDLGDWITWVGGDEFVGVGWMVWLWAECWSLVGGYWRLWT